MSFTGWRMAYSASAGFWLILTVPYLLMKMIKIPTASLTKFYGRVLDSIVALGIALNLVMMLTLQ